MQTNDSNSFLKNGVYVFFNQFINPNLDDSFQVKELQSGFQAVCDHPEYQDAYQQNLDRFIRENQLDDPQQALSQEQYNALFQYMNNTPQDAPLHLAAHFRMIGMIDAFIDDQLVYSSGLTDDPNKYDLVVPHFKLSMQQLYIEWGIPSDQMDPVNTIMLPIDSMLGQVKGDDERFTEDLIQATWSHAQARLTQLVYAHTHSNPVIAEQISEGFESDTYYAGLEESLETATEQFDFLSKQYEALSQHHQEVEQENQIYGLLFSMLRNYMQSLEETAPKQKNPEI